MLLLRLRRVRLGGLASAIVCGAVWSGTSIAIVSASTRAPGRMRCRPDDDKVVWRQARAHQTEAIDQWTCRHLAVLGDVILVDDEHEALVEVGADGPVLDQQAAMRGAAGKTKTDEEARSEAAVRVAKDPAHMDGARG